MGKPVTAAPQPEAPVAQQPPPLKEAVERYWNMLGKVADEGKCGSECHDALRALIAASKAESADQMNQRGFHDR